MSQINEMIKTEEDEKACNQLACFTLACKAVASHITCGAIFTLSKRKKMTRDVCNLGKSHWQQSQ